LDVIKNIEYLHSELCGNALRQFRLLHEREIDLPRVQSSDEAVGSIAKSTYQPIGGARRSEWRRGKCGEIDRDCVILRSSGQQQGNSGNKFRTLGRLVVAVRELRRRDVHRYRKC